MSQLEDIQLAQKSLEELFLKKMDELEAHLQTGGTAKDTVAKVAEEFRTFRELVYRMFGLLRKQISECAKSIDLIETRKRRKALVITGVPEVDKEDCNAVILGILQNKMSLKDINKQSLKVCHRLGKQSKDHHRPILVWFYSIDVKATVWRAKKALKGTSITIKEFLTKARQAVFSKARLHFGVRGCWTQDGLITIKTPDGSRHKILCMDDLQPILTKYPKVSMAATMSESQNT